MLIVGSVVAGCGTDTKGAASAALDPQVIKDGSLTVCTSFPYRPFEFKEDGQPTGFDIDLANALAKSLELKAVIVNAGFEDIASGKLLNDGTCDVAIAATDDHRRASARPRLLQPLLRRGPSHGGPGGLRHRLAG